MKFFKNTLFTLVLLLLPTFIFNVFAQLRPAHIFTDHMVLQRDMEVPIWGFSLPGESISVSIKSNQVTTVSDLSGKWSAQIPSMPAGGPYKIKIQSKSDTIVLNDVMIGEVWFASGQSNMEHALGGWPWIPYSQIKNYEQEIMDANYPQIRMFNVPKLASPVEIDDLNGGTWELPTTNTLPHFSAIAWFFAKELTKNLDVPIGIIHSVWGGTAITPWMDSQSLQTFENTISIPAVPSGFDKEEWSMKMDSEWFKHVALRNQISYAGLDRVPFHSKSDQIGIPWEPLGNITELKDYSKNWIWLRKEIEITDSTQNSSWELTLGHLNRQAHVFLNGVELGYFLYPKKVQIKVPTHVLKKGKNILLIRIAQPWGAPKVESEEFTLKNTKDNKNIDLYKHWLVLIPKEASLPTGNTYSGFTTYLFNGMVAPIIPYAIRGFLWNQGASDVGRPGFYQKAFPVLITEWRKRWGEVNAPFIFVQLSNYQPSWNHPEESAARAPLRLAQANALSLPNTSMVVSFDIGDPYDVHPANKQDFGHRIALQALSKVYGENILSDGPKYQSHYIIGDTLIVNLNRANEHLTSVPKTAICGFELAGTDGIFFKAKAQIHGNQIYVTSSKIKHPKDVRYAWSDNPKCFIYNSEGLPLAPFSTIY